MMQLRQTRAVLILRVAHAITIRLLPVNNSAPPTTTRIRPRQKAKPANNRAHAVG